MEVGRIRSRGRVSRSDHPHRYSAERAVVADLVPLEKLVKGRLYVGRGRNANVGLWEGSVFLVIGNLFDDFVVKREPYFTPESGCFSPFGAIAESQVVEPLGPVGWDASMLGR
jgi:hypothetical protein